MTKMWSQLWCLWTYFGRTLDILWSIFGVLLNAFGCSLMRADDIWRQLLSDAEPAEDII